MDKESLEISVYDHFKNYFNSRGVGIITDKQFVFYTQYNKSDGFNHDSALIYLDKKMYPYKKYDGFYMEGKDITFFSSDNEIYFVMPRFGSISENQLHFIKYILSEINKYNDESYDNKKAIINICNVVSGESIESQNVSDIEQFISIIEIRKEFEDEEIIIGNTIDDINGYFEIDSKKL